MIKKIFILLSVLCLFSCSKKVTEKTSRDSIEIHFKNSGDSVYWSKVYSDSITRIKSSLDSIYKQISKKDSVYIKDSIFVVEKADGTTERNHYIYEYKYEGFQEINNRIQVLMDSLSIVSCYKDSLLKSNVTIDSLRKEINQYKEKVVVKQSFWQNTKIIVVFILLISLIVCFIFWFKKLGVI